MKIAVVAAAGRVARKVIAESQLADLRLRHLFGGQLKLTARLKSS